MRPPDIATRTLSPLERWLLRLSDIVTLSYHRRPVGFRGSLRSPRVAYLRQCSGFGRARISSFVDPIAANALAFSPSNISEVNPITAGAMAFVALGYRHVNPITAGAVALRLLDIVT